MKPTWGLCYFALPLVCSWEKQQPTTRISLGFKGTQTVGWIHGSSFLSLLLFVDATPLGCHH